MGGFDVSLIPMIFLGFQAIVVGLFVIVHIFLGRKRGVTKTLWFFAGEIILAFVLMWGIGLFQANDWVTEALVRQYMGFLPMSGDLNAYMDEIIASGMLPLFLAIVDLSIKMSIFLLFYTILRFLFKWIIFGIPWAIFIKPIVKGREPNKLLGGLIGIFRGAFAGFFLIFPVLIVINTVVGEGVELEDPTYKDLSIAISEANQYNFVKYVNDATKIEGTGLADYMFDLAFRSDVKDGETIVWRLELEWIAEVAKVAVPYVLEENAEFNFTLAEIETFEGAFTTFTNSQLINSSVKPLLKFSILVAAKDENFTFFTDEEIQTLLKQIDDTDIELTKDLNDIYLSVVDLLTIQDYATWQQSMNELSLIADFDEADQDLFIGALNRLVTLDLLNLADPILSIFMYDSAVVNQITWLETNEERITLLNNVRQKISSHDGKFITNTLGELVELFETTFYKFPGIDLDNDGTIDVTLAEFISSIQDLSIVLNADPNYHTWFKEVLDGVGGLSAIDVFMEPLMGLAVNQLTGTDGALTPDDIELLKDLIEDNFSNQADLQRELSWMADVYKAIGDLHIGAMLQVGDHPAKIMDSLLIDSAGQTLFKTTVDTFLDGQTISALTSEMSAALIARYVTEPLSLAEPLNRAASLSNFSFNTEVDVLLDVLFGLYDEGMTLEAAMTNQDSNAMLETLLPSIVAYVRDADQKDKLLSSNIIYSFLDYNLTSIPMLETPDVIYETSGVYDGWVKKTEISNLLAVLDGLLTEMDNHDMDITDLLGGMDSMDAFFPVIKGYAQTSNNRDTLLASDIIYKTVDNLIQDIDLIEIPETAVEDDSNSPYYTWTKRIELNRILEAIVIMDLDVPTDGTPMNLDHITGDQINEVILVESAVMTRLLTTYIKDSGLISIPSVAYETTDELDLKQNELEALGELLADLNLTLGDLMSGDATGLLSTYFVSDLTSLDYQSSYLIKGFITNGIETGIGTPHPLALDSTYPEVLSELEIEALFGILDALDSEPSMTVDALMETLKPDALTYAQTQTIISSGDSIVIRGIFSENLLSQSIINDLTLQDAAFHVHNSVVQLDLISYEEMGKLVDALANINDSSAVVIDSVSSLDTDALTTANMISMNDKASSIIRTLVSDSIITYVTPARIHADAYDTGDLTQDELDHFLDAIAVLDDTYDDGDDDNDQSLIDLVNDLTATVSDLTIGQMQAMHQEGSLIMQKFMSEGIVEAVTIDDIRDEAFSDLPMEMIDYDEIDRLLSSLNVIALSMTGGEQVDADKESITSVVAGMTSGLTLIDVRLIAAESSMIAYRKITNVIVSELTIDIPTAALQNHGDGIDLTQTELVNLTYALAAFGLEDMDASTIDAGQKGLDDIKLVLDTDSHIADRLVSEAVTEAGLDTDESHEGMEDITIDIQKDELYNLVAAFKALGIAEIDNAHSMDNTILFTNAQTIGEVAFNEFIDYEVPNMLAEDEGLTIVSDFLKAKLMVNTRQELNELLF